MANLWKHRNLLIAALALSSILLYWATGSNLPLWFVLVAGGAPLLGELGHKLLDLELGSDLLAGISIITGILLGEYLASVLVVLMLSGGAALESFAIARASAALSNLAKRMPSLAHLMIEGKMVDTALEKIAIGDILVVFPHEACPVDGVVVSGHGVMDEAYLTGEPYRISKSIGSDVLSGALNGETAITIRATRRPADSRYAKIMEVMRLSEQRRPRLRRLGDQLGAFYTPLALALAALAWVLSGDSIRFLSVLVVATPCPLIIAIPVAIIGSVSLAAQRGIVIRDPGILERIGECRTMIFDKTGTLTYGEPVLVNEIPFETASGELFSADEVLALAATLEQYSRHPLATAVVQAGKSRNLKLLPVDEVREDPGEGLAGVVSGKKVHVTGRKSVLKRKVPGYEKLPPSSAGLECLIVIDNRLAAVYQFRDQPRSESRGFVSHLLPNHHFNRVMIISGDRESEVRYLAAQVGITEIHAGKSPEEKLLLVEEETKKGRTIYVGDGVNDAPALMAATVGLAMGQRSEVTTEAAGATILDSSLKHVDELIHLGERMRAIALQSAVGGMLVSILAMGLASFGYLTPVMGAIVQEVIDVFAVLNALRASQGPKQLADFRDSNS